MILDMLGIVLTLLYFGLNLKHYDLITSTATFANCILWLRYGILTFTISVISVNLFGVLCALYGIYKLSVNSKWNRLVFRNVLIVLILLLIIIKFQLYPVSTYLCGYAASIFSVLMFGSPLGHLMNVIKTRNAKLMNGKRIILSTGVSLSWLLIGMEQKDKFIMVPNEIGVALSIIQLIVYFKYAGGYRSYQSVKSIN
eukprot:NODE_317_length_11122_cov_0.359521.p6 type:complete len:198 gc:universal NODE_317_length_11122_cov_0.359521:10235-10828(+)